eukprot:834609-Rhodomonas_salina.1
MQSQVISLECPESGAHRQRECAWRYRTATDARKWDSVRVYLPGTRSEMIACVLRNSDCSDIAPAGLSGTERCAWRCETVIARTLCARVTT